MTQCDKIVEFMKKNDGITQKDAITFGCYRLAARIFDLRAEGYVIDSVREYNDGYFGYHAKYHLVKDPNETQPTPEEVLEKVEDAEYHGVDPVTYLKDVFRRWRNE